MKLRSLSAAALLVALSSGLALAEPIDTTGTGGGPASAAKAPYTTRTGATVPRPGAVDESRSDGVDRIIERDRASDREADRVMRGICIGCAPK